MIGKEATISPTYSTLMSEIAMAIDSLASSTKLKSDKTGSERIVDSD